jgi:membrane protein DedA with SNARE-associated domain
MTSLLPSFIESWGYAAIYLLMLLECFLPIFPSEIVMPIGALIATRGSMSLTGVIASGVLGALTGASIWYFLARLLGYDRFMATVVRYGRITTVSPREVEMLQKWFERFGAILVFAGRMIPGLRSAVSIPGGLVKMAFPRFFILSLLGILPWNVAMALVGWLLRDRYSSIERYIGPITTLIVLGAIMFWLYRVATYGRRLRAEDGLV